MRYRGIYSGIRLAGALKKYIEDTRGKISTAAFGLPFCGRCYALTRMGGFVLYVVSDMLTAERAASMLSALSGGRVDIITGREEVLLYKKAVSKDALFAQNAALMRMITGQSAGAVVTIEALTRLLPQRSRFESAILRLDCGSDYQLHDLARKLVGAGYLRTEQVDARGQFCMRGDIMDIFPIQSDWPVRLEFFGDTLEGIRTFDPATQKSFDRQESVLIAPATDVFIRSGELPGIRQAMELESAELALAPHYKARLKGIIEDCLTALENGSRDGALSYCLPYSGAAGKLADYLPEGAVVAADEPKQLADRLKLLYGEHDSRYESLLESGEVLPSHYGQLCNRLTLFEQFASFPRTVFSAINTSINLTGVTAAYNLKGTKTPRYSGNYEEFASDLANWSKNGYLVLIHARDDSTASAVAAELSRLNARALPYGGGQPPKDERCLVLAAELAEGAVIHDLKLVLVGTQDIMRQKKSSQIRRGSSAVFTAPEVGDYVVHETHGLGVCRGIKRLNMHAEKEYLSVEFKDGDMLYVPCDQLDVLAKYSGAEGTPKLSKIGGKEFAALKERVKKSVREMAVDLRALYLEREKSSGYAFSADGQLQREFEEAFEFEETPDQIRAIAEIKKDMQSSKVMDRLLCGDVGYGKTEVALRAAFKAVESGKQVALLSPTTILSQQHYNLCLKRFEGFGLRIGCLNRFSTPAEQRATAKQLAEGKLDIVSGTHRLLSSDIRFFDLGLLIVDEEQRFGVEDKEKIKLLRSDVDVLTLTATPIPRTLHLSLSGIRDISTLETPPKERLPVQTYVAEYTETLLRDAVLRELGRGGQVFVLHNRVESINSFAARLARLLPEAKVVVAHGQMKEDALESAIEKFYRGESNVLVCTTIIENGIDIPSANTLIVTESDRLGLAQLYQLRGRVGRSNRLAHVYFTYAEDKVLTENAYKRLSSIMEFTEFGSGFKIAMRDLEIRGAGSVLGREQHGHMEKVGYDMYVKLLKASVDELAGKAAIARAEMDVDIDAYIPDAYIPDSSARIRVYQAMAELGGEEDGARLLADLRDIYGPVPDVARNLITIALLRLFASSAGAHSVALKSGGAGITFRDAGVLQNAAVMNAVADASDMCVMSFSDRPVLIFRSKGLPGGQVLGNMYNFLTNLQKSA